MTVSVSEAPAPPDLPRERLLSNGPPTLSDADLVALILGTGSARLSARRAALSLVESMPMQEMAWASPDTFAGHPGIGVARGAALAAAFELGRRAGWSPPRRGEACLSPTQVFELMRRTAYRDVESFHVISLDVRGRLLRAVEVAQGSLSECPVSPRDALRAPVRDGAHGVIFVHNHPSGEPGPSRADFDLTDRLCHAAELLGIVPRDHVIVASAGYYSFVEGGRWR